MAHTGQGTAMQAHRVRVRFAPKKTTGPYSYAKDHLDVVTVRRWLRTDLSVPQIAAQLNVKTAHLINFIRRRNLCDLGARWKFILLQTSVAKDGEPIE